MNDPIYGRFFAVSRHRLATDGKGITTLCTFHGCPLHCRYCINKRFLASEQGCFDLTPDELYQRVAIDELYFLATGGGVTFGGGEPLLYPDFLCAFKELCGDKWQLNVETSLHVEKDAVIAAAKVIDTFIVDVKDTDPAIYARYTGCTNDRVLANLKLLLSLVGSERIVIRLPLIPAFNTDAHRQKSKAMLTEMGFTRFNLFTYTVN